MPKLRAIFLAFVLISASAIGFAAARDSVVVVAIPGNRPLTALTDGEVIGAATVIALRELGRDAAPRSLPFARMYDWVHAGRIDVATSFLRTPARAGLAHYSEPIITEYTVVIVPRGRAFPLQVIGDLAGKRIGGQIGFKYPPLEGTGIELVREGSYEINIRKVAEGTIDGALIGSATGPYLIQQLGLTENIDFLPAALGAVDLGVALSRKTFTDRDLAAFNSAIAALRESSAWLQILEQNGVAHFVRSWPILAN